MYGSHIFPLQETLEKPQTFSWLYLIHLIPAYNSITLGLRMYKKNFKAICLNLQTYSYIAAYAITLTAVW